MKKKNTEKKINPTYSKVRQRERNIVIIAIHDEVGGKFLNSHSIVCFLGSFLPSDLQSPCYINTLTSSNIVGSSFPPNNSYHKHHAMLYFKVSVQPFSITKNFSSRHTAIPQPNPSSGLLPLGRLPRSTHT